jgi:hypothetical protein
VSSKCATATPACGGVGGVFRCVGGGGGGGGGVLLRQFVPLGTRVLGMIYSNEGGGIVGR